MRPSVPSIFEFTDYHQFFKVYYQRSKAAKRAFSFRFFARRAKVSPSLLVAVIKGQRRISPAVAAKYASAMGLTARETDYLLALVEFERAKTHARKNDAFSRIVRLRAQSKLKFLDADQYEYFSRWYHAVIREFISLPFFKEDPAWIASMLIPPISEAQARKSLYLLQRLSLVERDESGRLRVTSKAISSDYEVPSLLLRNFSGEMIDRAREALESAPMERREISGLTMGISDECIDRIKHRIRMFKEEIITMVVEDNNVSRNVYQLNFQFFPLVLPPEPQREDVRHAV